ncbi:MAG: hypothetical protein NT062_16040 [Proteobacteria bacterium]|nr:hypothetical protein [Pseudomonadota bacterium]
MSWFSSHIIFIPSVLLVGMFLGFIVGARAARNQFDMQQKRADERAAVRAARDAKKAQPAAEQAAPVEKVEKVEKVANAPKAAKADKSSGKSA